MTFTLGQIISYPEMCAEEETALQRGMNFRLHHRHSVLLMSRRPNAPYADQVEDNGRVLIYEGHDDFRRRGVPDPKSLDQPEYTHRTTHAESSLRGGRSRISGQQCVARACSCL